MAVLKTGKVILPDIYSWHKYNCATSEYFKYEVINEYVTGTTLKVSEYNNGTGGLSNCSKIAPVLNSNQSGYIIPDDLIFISYKDYYENYKYEEYPYIYSSSGYVKIVYGIEIEEITSAYTASLWYKSLNIFDIKLKSNVFETVYSINSEKYPLNGYSFNGYWYKRTDQDNEIPVIVYSHHQDHFLDDTVITVNGEVIGNTKFNNFTISPGNVINFSIYGDFTDHDDNHYAGPGALYINNNLILEPNSGQTLEYAWTVPSNAFSIIIIIGGDARNGPTNYNNKVYVFYNTI